VVWGFEDWVEDAESVIRVNARCKFQAAALAVSERVCIAGLRLITIRYFLLSMKKTSLAANIKFEGIISISPNELTLSTDILSVIFFAVVVVFAVV
jgi:hypothetical protein